MFLDLPDLTAFSSFFFFYLFSLQDGPAAEFNSLTKTLYDLQKSQEPAGYRGSPLAQLVVDNFDEEQIWQELELQNNAVMKHFKNAIDEALNKTLTLLSEEEEEEYANGEEDKGATEDENDSDQPSKRRNKKAAEPESDSEEDTDIDFDVDALEKRRKQTKQRATDPRAKVVPSEVDDKFFKLSEMESFLDEMDKREGKENKGEDDVDYFQDIPSDEDDDLDLDQIISSKYEKKNKVCTLNISADHNNTEDTFFKLCLF